MLNPMNTSRNAIGSELERSLAARGETIFHAALEVPSDQRATYLEKACGSDGALRQQVDLLLRAHKNAGGFMEGTHAAPLDKTADSSITSTERSGGKIGRYKLLQQIGEGGCGIVYMAEQEEPVRRRVALKVIKLGMDTKSVMARFEAERQALALMDHPNIARVLDAGATETGRPYFVMELVRGIKITDYCDQNKLSTKERLKLFIQVCHAIQHAHQKGIIHRDIKPSNILVTLHDGVPVPKVIDFGIAKATQGRLTDQTVFTAFEQFIGTPAYMSPEQAEMSGMDIDTRCDIYALGVLLYELLTGKTPFDAKELLASGLDKMRHTIRERDPEAPSTRLSTMLNAELTSTANHHRTDAPKLIHLMRGDLDWIVMKTLEKDRTRRYETANALAADIQRHLEDEPVLASPPSNLYRFQKLVRRNKSIFGAAAAAAIALLIGFAVSVYLFVQERDARQRAVAAEKEQSRLRQAAEDGARIGAKLTQAGLFLSREQYDEAEKIVSEVHHPGASAILNVLGMLHARRGEWPAAISDFTRTIDLVPNDHDAYHALVPLLLKTGDIEGYGRLRERILRQFGGSLNPTIAERMAKDSLILPPAKKDLETISKMADIAIAAGPSHVSWDYFQFVKGLAEYRQRNFAEAAEWLGKIISHERDPNRTVAAYMVLAMTKHALGEKEEAHALLDKGLKMGRERVATVNGPIWYDQMTTQLLMREGSTLIGNGQIK